MRSRGSTVLALMLLGGMLGGCSRPVRQDLRDSASPVDNSIEAMARYIVGANSTKAFENEGVVVAGDLQCTATPTSGAFVSDYSVECTGTSTEGEKLAVEATLRAKPGPGGSPQGSFVGTADGKEVFFHRSECQSVQFDSLSEGQEVSFDRESDVKGPRARNIRLT